MADNNCLLPVGPRCTEDVARRSPVERVWNLPPCHDGNSDVSPASTLTLRSDGTGHLSMLIDNDDRWEVAFEAYRNDGRHIFHLPDTWGDGTRFFTERSSRQIDFRWNQQETLLAIAQLSVTYWH